VTRLPLAPPPSGLEAIGHWSLDSALALSPVRAGVRGAVGSRCTPPEPGSEHPAEHIVLAASELATNALQHGRPPSALRLSHKGDRFVIAVSDHAPGLVPHFPDERPRGEGGRGLLLVRAAALSVGYYVFGETKQVWASFRSA
jgi:serine/threonine-protein kinase RsbW